MLKIGLVSVSDRASSGVYQDQGIPALQDWLASALSSRLPRDPADSDEQQKSKPPCASWWMKKAASWC
jgi:molybdopterin biosynthesis enzyme MoaB